jgi:radical SAM protein with 4Fe4S-binding SPASM domain
VVDFKLRQEKRGAYLLDRRRGMALQLSQAAFDLLRELHAIGGRPPDWPQAGITRHFGAQASEGRRWWQTLEEMGLAQAQGLRSLQVIPLDDDPASVPDDCLAAPARVYFELTRRCNLACRTCFNNSRHPLAGELTTPEIVDALDQLDRLGVFEIRFTGGESTEHPDFREIVAYARARGFYMSLGTNGVYGDEKRSWIYESGVDWFIVSLDGAEEVNDRVRGPGTYRQVVRTLGELAQRPHLRVRLNMVVARHNVHTIEDVACLADEYGVESLNMIPLRPYGRSVKTMTPDMFDQHDFYAFIQRIGELRPRHRCQFITTLDLLDPDVTTSHDPIVQKKRTCAAGVEATVVGATGDVYGCSYSPASFPDSPDAEGRRLFVAGNLRREPLCAIWRDSSRWAVFRYLDTYKNPRCLVCDHYGVRCIGSCPIMGYFQTGQPQSFDPYCFVDLLPCASQKS